MNIANLHLVCALAAERDTLLQRISAANAGNLTILVGADAYSTGHRMADPIIIEAVKDDVSTSFRRRLKPIEAELMQLGVDLAPAPAAVEG
jgi:hypothetical protein